MNRERMIWLSRFWKTLDLGESGLKFEWWDYSSLTRCLLLSIHITSVCSIQGVLTLKNSYLEPRYVLVLPVNECAPGTASVGERMLQWSADQGHFDEKRNVCWIQSYTSWVFRCRHLEWWGWIFAKLFIEKQMITSVLFVIFWLKYNSWRR